VFLFDLSVFALLAKAAFITCELTVSKTTGISVQMKVSFFNRQRNPSAAYRGQDADAASVQFTTQDFNADFSVEITQRTGALCSGQ
jgi:hypothetical protein